MTPRIVSVHGVNTSSNVPKRDAETVVVDRLLANYQVTIVGGTLRAHEPARPDAPPMLLPATVRAEAGVVRPAAPQAVPPHAGRRGRGQCQRRPPHVVASLSPASTAVASGAR